MTPTQKTILNFQIVLPSVATLIAVVLKAVHIVGAQFNWFSIFLPLMISVPVGVIMITIIYLFEIVNKKETN